MPFSALLHHFLKSEDSLGARYMIGISAKAGGCTDRNAECFEECLAFVVIVLPLHGKVSGDPAMDAEAVEEVLEYFSLNSPPPGMSECTPVDEVSPTAAIEGNSGKRFIHGDDRMRKPRDPPAVPYRIPECLAKDNPGVLYGVMDVHFEVAFRPAGEAETSVSGHGGEHVIKKRDSSGDLSSPRAVKVEDQIN